MSRHHVEPTEIEELSVLDLPPPEPSRERLPGWIVGAVYAICLVPGFLVLTGFDFGSATPPLDIEALRNLPASLAAESAAPAFSGVFVHAFLEWAAVAAAVFTGILGFAYYRVRGDIATPIVGLALFGAGTMDAFHSISATRLADTVANNRDLLPVTWAFARTYHAVVVVAGIGLCLSPRRLRVLRSGVLFTLSTVLFGVLAYAVVYWYASTAHLPRTLFPDAILTRPADAVPLVIWLVAGVTVLPRFQRRHGTLFSHALILSVVVQVAAQAHMAFGSTAMYDSHFHIAHFLKIVSYGLPMAGILFDYERTARNERARLAQLGQAQAQLRRQARHLEEVNSDLLRRNEELDEFTYVASHDLQEPLRKLISFSEFLREDAGEELPERANTDIRFITDSARRMSRLVTDLLDLSRSGKAAMEMREIPLRDCVDEALDSLALVVTESGARIRIDELPSLPVDRTLIVQTLTNLLSNALKFVETGRTPEIHVTAEPHEHHVVLGVRDHGIGIPEEFQNRIFVPFKRLQGRRDYAGTGIGLAICRKAVERHGGELWVESEPGHGSHFKLRLDRRTPHLVDSP